MRPYSFVEETGKVKVQMRDFRIRKMSFACSLEDLTQMENQSFKENWEGRPRQLLEVVPH